MPQHVAALAPEARDGFPDRRVVAARVPVDVAGVREFRDGGRGHEVDFRMREEFEGGQGEFFREGVDFCVFEELGARGVDGGRGRVGLQGSGGELVGEVFACVEVFEEAGGGFDVGVLEVDGVVLFYFGKRVVGK